ncbi:glycosyltransferase family 4 protein [Mycolicibacterium sp.]|uniref:glycosyltransferase family 4 protein n=1 Tax=Mycolicibacterium sp. TaxID=2320850 RepID=UPI003D131ADD
MTVFHVLPQFHYVNERTIIGGYPSVVGRLAVAQAAQGSRVEIVARMPESVPPTFSGVALSKLEVLDATSHRHPLRFARKLFVAIRKRVASGDVIHVHSGHAEYAVVSAVLALFLRGRVRHTLYCPVRPGLRGVAQRLAIRSAVACGVAFSGMSNNICRSMRFRATWTPPVLDSDYFAPGESDVNDYQLLFVGNATPSKGLADLLRAFANLVEKWDQGEKLSLVVTTELKRTSEHSELQEAINDLQGSAALSQITWLSIVPDMKDLLASSAIHVAPFRTTNGPSDYFMATLEAMSMGKVCVVSDLAGMSEVIGDGKNGFAFKAGDSADLERALSRALECDRAEIGRSAREFVIETFGTTAVEITNSLYGEVDARIK